MSSRMSTRRDTISIAPSRRQSFVVRDIEGRPTLVLEDTDDDDEPVKAVSSKNHITELRRRIEERLDSKRIEHEFDFDDLDGMDLDDVDLNGLLDNMS